LLHSLKDELFYIPPVGQRAWDWFWELDRGRQVGMEANAISWGDIEGWRRVTGATPELWELNAIYRMGIYRVNPDYDPHPKKEEPVSMVKALKAIQDEHLKENIK
jgi:hypothetical protein